MKKVLIITFILMFASASFVSARTVYDKYGRVIQDDTIRGKQRANMEKIEQQKKIQAAAAAKIDYDEALKSIEEKKPDSHIYSNPNYRESRQYKGTLR